MTTQAPTMRRRPEAATDEWVPAIQRAEDAIAALLLAKRKTLKHSPDREAALWSRHHGRLAAMKRQLDAVVM